MSAHADLRRILTRAEALLDEHARLRQAAPDAQPDRAALDAVQADLEQQLSMVDALPSALARRVRSVRARLALQAREAPTEVLDGMADAVHAAVQRDAWGRAGMSVTFLDAPRALGRWRAVATAACVVLALGAFALGRARVSFDDPPAPTPLADPRDELLRPFDASSAVRGGLTGDPTGAVDAHPVGLAAPERGRFDPRRGSASDGVFEWRARDGVVLFHLQGKADARGAFSIEEDTLLDGADRRLRVRVLRGPLPPDERESN